MFSFFFFNDTATTEIYTLSLHDALPISRGGKGGWGNQRFKSSTNRSPRQFGPGLPGEKRLLELELKVIDRKSTRLNSSHSQISYAVFCLKKKKHERNII